VRELSPFAYIVDCTHKHTVRRESISFFFQRLVTHQYDSDNSADREWQEHQARNSSVEAVSLGEDDRVCGEKEIEAAIHKLCELEG